MSMTAKYSVLVFNILLISNVFAQDAKKDLSQYKNDLFKWSIKMEGAKTTTLYGVPEVEKFRQHYQADKANQKKQSWNQYSSWIKTFYKGRLFVGPGWNDTCNKVLEGVGSGSQRSEMTTYLNVLGRVIAAEWSKDNAVRKISTSDVKLWGDRLKKAKRGDSDGSQRYQELKSIAKIAAKALASKE